MSSLPVAAVLPELLSALQHAPQVLLNAPTGAGKSTWLPLQILAEGNIAGRIILLEPRRLAARNVAQRLAELLGEKPGETVGFRMRAETCVGPQTRLEVVTEGILTRMIQRDPELTGVGLVILDEFHERSLQADLALALLLDVQQGLRDDLKLLIMSATLDNDRLQRLLPEAPVVVSEGRIYPVERRFSPLSAQQRFDEAVAVAAAELLRHEQGSMLLFLPGVGEIQRVLEQLTERVAEDVILCPLYGALPLSEQRKAILPAPAGKRKVVLATNIAETSLTIEGIRLVVDSAQERVARFDPRTGLTRLVTQRISQASMTQRAGRAGRLSPGICLHLLGKEQAERAAAQSEPEILHSDLSALLLELLQWGCHDPAALAWLDQPPAVNLAAARRLLEALSALDGERLSAFGRKMAALGNEPRLAVAVRPVAKGGGDLAGAQRRLAEQRQQPNEDVGRVGRSVASLIRAMVDGIEVKAGVPVADRGADFAIVEGKAAPLLRPGLRQVRLTGRVQRIALQQRGGHIFRRQGVPSGLQIIEGHGGMLIHDRGALGHGAGEDHHQGEDEQHHQERDAALPIYHWPPPGVSKNRRVISPLFASVRVISSPCGSLCGRSQVSCQRPSA